MAGKGGIIGGIAAAIGSAVAAAIFTPEIVKTVLSTASDAIASIWSWAVNNHAIPGWAIVLASSFALVGMVQIASALKGETELESVWRNYVCDIIFGVKWRWQWTGQNLHGLWCFCTICDSELVYDDRREIFSDQPDTTKFYCEHCGHSMKASIQGVKAHAIGTVTREIYRRLRTGEKP